MIYAGIGSRETPLEIMDTISFLASNLTTVFNATLRSGRAKGADTAFEIGARRWGGRMELFTDKDATPAMIDHASKYHPAWQKCSGYARRLHARNSAIILGADLNSPVDFVICWTKDGNATGGTGQGIRVAEAYNIPVFNLRFDPKASHFWNWMKIKP